MPKQRPGEYQRAQSAPVAPSFADLGIDRSNARRWQTAARMTEAERDAYIAEVRRLAGELTSAEAYRRGSRNARHERQRQRNLTPHAVDSPFLAQDLAASLKRVLTRYPPPPRSPHGRSEAPPETPPAAQRR
jgi:hypothetical protein